MILLFPQDETIFDNNGIGALSDAISCTVTEERNGIFELEMQYPITGIHYAELTNRNILLVKPSPYHDPEPFRIYRITKPLTGRITIYAQHISYDLSGIVVSPFTAGGAVDTFLKIKQQSSSDNPFAFNTDISSSSEMTVSVPSAIRSIMGGAEGSILDTFGGEYEYERWNVYLRSRRGTDNGVSIRYGKNLTDLQQDENIANVATGIYPYWNGENGTVTLTEEIVEAPGTYSFTRIKPLDLSGEFEEMPTEEQLRERAVKYVTDNNIGVPTVSITVSFQPLEQTEEYENIALLERVNLCDTVTVEYPNLGVSATAKCVKTVYDALKDKYNSIELGEAKSNIADTIVEQQQKIEKVPTTSAIQMAIANATKLITGNSGGYVVMRDSPDNKDGEPDEILIMDKPDVNDAQKVWRWNMGGLGYSSNGVNGPYTTAITQDGSIVANFITSGTMNAGIVTTGVLKSNDGNTYINLDTGQFRFQDKLKLIGVDLYVNGKLYSGSLDDVYIGVGERDGMGAFYVHDAEAGNILEAYTSGGDIYWTTLAWYNGSNDRGIKISKDTFDFYGMYDAGGFSTKMGIFINLRTGDVDISGVKVNINGTSFDDLVKRVETLERK
jgi:phage minor structural protein